MKRAFTDEDIKDIATMVRRIDPAVALDELKRLYALVDKQEKVIEKLKKRKLPEELVEWVVNDIAELGVKINNQCFFMYKGRSYVGGSKYRSVFRREFGECCHPWNAIETKMFGKIANPQGVRLPDRFIGFFGEDEEEWKDIPNG